MDLLEKEVDAFDQYPNLQLKVKHQMDVHH